jgi:hypothetical protein
MKVSMIRSVPHGQFAEVSVLSKDWQERFQSLINEQQPIKFDFYPMPDVPSEVRQSVMERGYKDFVWQKDRWQHFFVPKHTR